MCSSKDLVTEPFVRFGLTEQVFNDLRVAHDVMNCTKPTTRSCNELPFFDWEARLLAKLLEDNKENVPLCALVAAMMYSVHVSVQKELGKKVVTKPLRQNTMGMFFAPPEQTTQV